MVAVIADNMAAFSSQWSLNFSIFMLTVSSRTACFMDIECLFSTADCLYCLLWYVGWSHEWMFVCYLCDMLNSCTQSRLFSGHKSQNVGFLTAFLTLWVSTVVKITVKAWAFGDGHNWDLPSHETQRNWLEEQNLSTADLSLVTLSSSC